MSSSVTAEGDEALTGLVVMEDEGQGHEGEEQACYLTFNSHPLVFHKVEQDEDDVNDGTTTTVVTVEYLDHVVGLDDPSSSIQFDDEHARAVANLLEFHNQQTNFSYTGGEEDGVEGDGVGEYSESGEMVKLHFNIVLIRKECIFLINFSNSWRTMDPDSWPFR